MSRGPGHVQRAVRAIFDTEPEGRFTVKELASRIYPDRSCTVSEANSIGRVLRQQSDSLGLTRCNAGAPGKPGYCHVWGKRK